MKLIRSTLTPADLLKIHGSSHECDKIDARNIADLAASKEREKIIDWLRNYHIDEAFLENIADNLEELE